MRSFSSLLIAAVLLLSLSSPSWADVFHPPRTILLAHAGVDLNDSVRLEYRFIPSGDLTGAWDPQSFLGAKIKVKKDFIVETYLGWVALRNEPFASLTLNPEFTTFGYKWYIWTEVDYRFLSKGGYYFAQADVIVADWLQVGPECEGWGNYSSASSWSHGAGGNLQFVFGKIQLDTAVQVRDLGKPQFILRTHLFF